MGIRIVREQLQHPPELLSRFGVPVHVNQQLAKLKQSLRITRINPQLLQVQLASAFKTTKPSVRAREVRPNPRQLRIKPSRFTQTPDRTLMMLGPLQRLAHHRV